jgi:hypothetical protein
MKRSLVSGIFILFFALAAIAQDAPPALRPVELTKEQEAYLFATVPVVYGKKNDGFPRKIKVRGVVEDQTVLPFSCGVWCGSGTIKVRLIKERKGYPQEYIYASVMCMHGENLIGKTVEFEAEKIMSAPEQGCYNILNRIDSKGVPFYRVISGLLEKFREKPASK